MTRERFVAIRDVAGFVLVFAFIIGLVIYAIATYVSEGTITQKWVVPAHEETRYNQIYMGQNCYGSGKTESCIPWYIYVPYQVHIDDACHVEITDGEHFTDHTFDCGYYRKYDVGDFISFK